MLLKLQIKSRRTSLSLLVVLAIGGLWTLDYFFFRPRPTPLGPPTIITRTEWGAVAPDLRLQNPKDREVFKTVVIHHSAMPPDEGPREIQQVHMQGRNFLDVGYHFLIDREGRIYEGRSLAVHGAHVREHNAGTLGIVLLGNYEEIEPTIDQLQRLRWLIGALMANHPLTHLAGHSDFLPGKTLCPGKNLAPLLPKLAAELGLQFGAGGYVGPEPTPDSPPLPVNSAVDPRLGASAH